MSTYLQSLCWNCSKGADECCFMRSLEPVPNWEAKKVLCEGNRTYHVIKCPNFEPMRETSKMRFKTKPGTRIRCVETGQIYPSIRQCARESHISECCISNHLHSRVGTVRGLHFEKV